MGEYLPPVVTELKGNSSDLIASIELAKAAMRSFKDEADGMKIRVGVSGIIGPTAGAIAQIEALKAALADVGNTEIKIGADANVMAAATTAATARAAGGFRVWGMTAGSWLKIIHNLVMVFSAQVIADTIGIVAFGAAVTQTLGPVFTNISNLGKAWSTFSGAQKVAAENTFNFINGLQNHDVQVLAVYDSLLSTVASHMKNAGSVTDQASFAFMKFAAQVKASLGAPEWQRIIGESGGQIGTDLSALLTTIGRLGNALVSLAHNFNFLGLWALSGIGMVAKGIVALNNLNPTLARFALLTLSAYHAINFLRNSALVTGVSSFLLRTTGGVAGLTGAFQNFRMFGIIPTLGFMTGLTSAAAVAAAGFGVVTAGVIALYIAMNHGPDIIQRTSNALAVQDHAVGDNLAGYQALAKGLIQYKDSLYASIKAGTASLQQEQEARGLGVELQNQIDAAKQKVQTLTTNFKYLENTFHLTQTQAAQVAKSLGLVNTATQHVFTPTERAAIQSYMQALIASRNPLTQLQFDMAQAANSALGLQSQIQGLTNAFNVMVAPFANTIQATVTWKNDIVTMQKAVAAASGVVGYHTAVQRAAAASLATNLTDTINLSNATLASTGSYRQAAAIVLEEIKVLENLHSTSSIVAQAIAELRTQLDSLHNKTVTITFVSNGVPGVGVVPPTVYHHMTMTPGLTVPSGSNSSSIGISAPAVIENHIYIDSREVTKAVGQRAVRRQKRSGFNGQARVLR